MAYTPANPYPKGRGDAIRSADWNDAVNEVVRLENDKFNKAGGTVNGNLAVTGTVSGTLVNNIVGANQIAGNAVTTTKIADLNVTTVKIADNAVTTAKILDGNISTGKLANGSVTADKIADGTVTGAKMPNSTIPVDRLLGNVYYFQTTLTLGGSVNSTYAIYVTNDQLNTSPPPAPTFPLFFVSTGTDGAMFGYALDYRRYISGGNSFGGHVVTFTNKVAVTTEIILSAYIFRRS